MSDFAIFVRHMSPNPATLYMQRCLELALNGAGHVSPNPLVGAVIVHEGRIIGEGWHRQYGEPHAEVNAVNSVHPQDRHLLTQSTIYVSLEPCSHHGKTPPCTDLILATGIPRVVVANTDPYPLVAGRGLERLRNAGVEVVVGVLEQEAEWVNRRFMTNQRLKRPYVVLKWAQSTDGFLAPDNQQQHWITGTTARKLVHRWRSEEDAVMVGTQTAFVDNPRLDIRYWPNGKQPLRVVVDAYGTLPNHLHLFDGTLPTLVITTQPQPDRHHVQHLLVDDTHDLDALLSALHNMGIGSLLVEGGTRLLNSFIGAGVWDEARVLVGNTFFGGGLQAPLIKQDPIEHHLVGDDQLYLFKRQP